MKFETEHIVEVKDIGINNQMTNFAFLSIFEEIASMHSNLVGYGVKDIERQKRVWLIMDWQLKVLERPEYGEKLTVKTWARPIPKHLFYTYRDFEVFCGGKRVAYATSKWVFYNLEINRIDKITSETIKLYNPEEIGVFEEEEIEKIKEPEEKELMLNYEVRRADIDINKHMHNLNYLKIAYETLPEEIYFSEERKNVRIMYKHEILLGNKINCYYTKQDQKNIITIKSEDNKTLHAIIEIC